MNYRLVIGLWAIFSVSIIYWNLNRYEDKIPLSACHNAEIRMYHDRPVCIECKLFCEVFDGKK